MEDTQTLCLTRLQAYAAMFLFIEHHYVLTHSDELGSMLGGMSLLEDWNTADSAYRQDWIKCVDRVLAAAHSEETWLQFLTDNLLLQLDTGIRPKGQ